MIRRMDLLPDRYLAKRKERREAVTVVVAGLLVLLLLLGWWFLLTGQVSDEEDKLASVQAQNATLEAQIAELQQFSDLQAQIQAKSGALSTVMAGDVNWPSLLTELAMVIPGEVWLETLTASAGATEGSSQVGTETAEIRVARNTPVGRIAFTGKSLTMPGVARWLIRQASVRVFSAVWLNSATAEETEGSIGDVTFDSTLELGRGALSRRYEGGDLP
jgi:Tfp pilus assembly protein PilN